MYVQSVVDTNHVDGRERPHFCLYADARVMLHQASVKQPCVQFGDGKAWALKGDVYESQRWVGRRTFSLFVLIISTMTGNNPFPPPANTLVGVCGMVTKGFDGLELEWKQRPMAQPFVFSAMWLEWAERVLWCAVSP